MHEKKSLQKPDKKVENVYGVHPPLQILLEKRAPAVSDRIIFLIFLLTACAVRALCDAVWRNRYVPQTKRFFWHILTPRLVVRARTLCAPLITPQRQKRQPFGD